VSVRVNPRLIKELEDFGAEDVSKCYHCGNCSAACPFSDDPVIFPRRAMRYLQMGASSRLRTTLSPWLCYYCGECSEQCPRGAEPGETMMSLRRWLTSQYDITGISSWMYRSWQNQILFMVLLAVLTGVGLVYYGFNFGGGSLSVYEGEQAFLPHHFVHIFDWVMGGVIFTLLGINMLRMWYFLMRGDTARPVPLGSYISSIFLLPIHFLTQKRFSECGNKQPWKMHMMIMFGYTIMLVLIVFFLPLMQEGYNFAAHFFGYLASAGLLIGLTWALRGRLNKTLTFQQKSHHSDWVFTGMLLFLAVTGVIQHVLHRMGLPYAANLAYIVHLSGVVCFEVSQVPFGKWAHLAYRPLAMYYAHLQKESWAAGVATYDGKLPATSGAAD
jgi:ferredoxin